MKYKILSHTADLRLEVYGKTTEELFVSASQTLADILTGNQKLLSHMMAVAEKISIQSLNLNTLLVDFLNEVLAKSHINKAVYKVKSITVIASGAKQSLEAEIIGNKVPKFEEDIKAVTYHEVNIKKENGIFKTLLVLDV